MQLARLFRGQFVRVVVQEDVVGSLVVVPEWSSRVGKVASREGGVEEVEEGEEEEE